MNPWILFFLYIAGYLTIGVLNFAGWIHYWKRLWRKRQMSASRIEEWIDMWGFFLFVWPVTWVVAILIAIYNATNFYKNVILKIKHYVLYDYKKGD